jgi:hypothetical protein
LASVFTIIIKLSLNSFGGYPSLDMVTILYGGVVVQWFIWGGAVCTLYG